MESNRPLMKSDETHQNEANPFDTLNGTDDDKEDADNGLVHEITGTRTLTQQSRPQRL